MRTLKEEFLSLKDSLEQLELGRRNVIQHLQVHVKIIMQPPSYKLWKRWSNLLLFRKTN